MKPYWQSDDGSITVYNARWENVLAAGCVPVREVKLVHADPPYGVNERTDRKSKGRGVVQGQRREHMHSTGKKTMPNCRDWPAVVGDDKPFDPAALLALGRPLVTWGANHYADRLPSSPSWITWDKREGIGENDNADCEHAWSNLGGPARLFAFMWNGVCRAGEAGSTRRLHPTQKPIALSAYVFQRAKLKPGDLVLVPYLGSGPDLPAARAMGLCVIGCDVERWCCDTAIGRLGAVTPERAAEPVGPLFSAERTA